jgi:hypothetical protein
MKTLPPITKSQKQIILFLYKFRFTTTSQLQKHFNHKDSKRIKEWLKDLRQKKYITAVVDSKDITKPYIYCLASLSRQVLKENKDISEDFLNRIYKEKNLTKTFKEHCLFLVDIYLFFLSQKDKNSKMAFCTPQDLESFDYLPKDLDAYIAVETNGTIKRYFLELFDEYKDKTGVIRYSFRKYVTYFEDGTWQANTNNNPLPSIFFVMASERRRAFVSHYGKAKLEKTFEDISLYVTTQNIIRFSKQGQNIWQKVEEKDLRPT